MSTLRKHTHTSEHEPVPPRAGVRVCDWQFCASLSGRPKSSHSSDCDSGLDLCWLCARSHSMCNSHASPSCVRVFWQRACLADRFLVSPFQYISVYSCEWAHSHRNPRNFYFLTLSGWYILDIPRRYCGWKWCVLFFVLHACGFPLGGGISHFTGAIGCVTDGF